MDVLDVLTMMFLFVLLFIVAGGGAGDAKLMGAGIWLGLINGLFALAECCWRVHCWRWSSRSPKGDWGWCSAISATLCSHLGTDGGARQLVREVDVRLEDGKWEKIPYGVGISPVYALPP